MRDLKRSAVIITSSPSPSPFPFHGIMGSSSVTASEHWPTAASGKMSSGGGGAQPQQRLAAAAAAATTAAPHHRQSGGLPPPHPPFPPLPQSSAALLSSLSTSSAASATDVTLFNTAFRPHHSFRSVSSASALSPALLPSSPSLPPAVNSPSVPVFAPSSSSFTASGGSSSIPASVLSPSSLPLSLPLPLLSSLNADLRASPQTQSALSRRASFMSPRQSLPWLLAAVDWWLPAEIRARSRRTAVGGLSSQDLKDESDLKADAEERPAAAAPAACTSCHHFGYHVCVWRWRGLVVSLALSLLLSLAAAPLSFHCSRYFLSALYSAVVAVCSSLLLRTQSLPAADCDAFLSSFSSYLSGCLWSVFALQALNLGLTNPLCCFFGCMTAIAVATFLCGSQAGVKYYLLSLLLNSAVYVRSYVPSSSLLSALPLDTAVDTAVALSFLREQYILYTPLFLTLLTGLLLIVHEWSGHTVALLSASISRQRQLTDAALSASKLKSEFLANVSHDIRTPMNSILGFLQLALVDQQLSDETKENLSMAFSSAEDLLSLLNDILDISKIESGHLRFESIEFNLQQVFERSVKTFAALAQKKHVELIFEVDPQLQSRQYAVVKGDPSRLAQIVNNLLSNAVKFTSPRAHHEQHHAQIVVRVSLLSPLQPGYVHIHTTVADTGEGISASGLARIFQPFIQADSTVTRRHGGTGLGLAISSELVKLSGGRIWCQSEVGKGSCFNFTSQFQLVAEQLDAQLVKDSTDLFSSLAHDVQIHDGNSASAISPHIPDSASSASASSSLQHASSEPLPSRRIESEQKLIQIRVLLAVHNPTLAEVVSRHVSYWSNREYAHCSASTPCAKCASPFSFNSAAQTLSHHHTTYIEIVPSSRVSTDYVVQELLWAKTTRQPYDLLILDESSPQLDTVRILQQMQRRRVSVLGKPAVLILTTRLLSPVLRGNGSSTYVLISKPVIASDFNQALQLLLRSAPEHLRSLPIISRKLDGTRVLPAHHKQYVGSSRRPREDDDDEEERQSQQSQLQTGGVQHGHRAQNTDAQHDGSEALASHAPGVDIAAEDKDLLREPHSLSREALHVTSVPPSPVGPASFLPHTPASAVVNSQTAVSTVQAETLPAPSALWDTRAQSLPDLLYPGGDASDAEQHAAAQQDGGVRSRSRSLSTPRLSVDPHALPVSPQHPEAADVEVAAETPHASQAAQSPEQEEEAEGGVHTVYAEAVMPATAREEPQSRAQSAGSTRSVSASSSSSMTSSALSSAAASPRPSAAADKTTTILSSLANSDRWTASPPRHHPDYQRLTRSITPSVRRLLPTSQAVASHGLAGDLLPARSLSPSLSSRVNSATAAGSQLGSRGISSSDASPGALSQPESPVLSAELLRSETPSPLHAAATLPALQPRSGLPARRGMHVLVVDDNLVNLKVASKMLERLGYIAHTARSGEEAIEFLDRKQAAHDSRQQQLLLQYPELIRGPSADEAAAAEAESDVGRWVVLMDVIMGGMDGMEATRVLRSRGHRMPIFALTANVMQGDKDKALQSGMTGFICKPLRMEDLQEALTRSEAALQDRDREKAGAVGAEAAAGSGS